MKISRKVLEKIFFGNTISFDVSWLELEGGKDGGSYVEWLLEKGRKVGMLRK